MLPVYCAYWKYCGTTPNTRCARSISAILAVPVLTVTTGRNTASSWQNPQYRSLKYLMYSSIPQAEYSTAVVNCEIRRVWHYQHYTISKYVLRVLAVSQVFSLRNIFLHSQVMGASVKHSFTDRWSLEWQIERITFAGGNWIIWSILAISSSIYFGSILRVLALFPGSIYFGYYGYCKASISDICTAGAACALGDMYTTHHVPSSRCIWAFNAADTPSTRIINLAHHNSRVPQ